MVFPSRFIPVKTWLWMERDSYPGQYAQYVSGSNASNVGMSHPNRQAEVNQFFNTGAFVNPNNEPLGTYGNSSKGIIYGPAYADTDASLLKDFALPEYFRLQFRAESFNTLQPGELLQSKLVRECGYARSARFNLRWLEPGGNSNLR